MPRLKTGVYKSRTRLWSVRTYFIIEDMFHDEQVSLLLRRHGKVRYKFREK